MKRKKEKKKMNTSLKMFIILSIMLLVLSLQMIIFNKYLCFIALGTSVEILLIFLKFTNNDDEILNIIYKKGGMIMGFVGAGIIIMTLLFMHSGI